MFLWEGAGGVNKVIAKFIRDVINASIKKVYLYNNDRARNICGNTIKMGTVCLRSLMITRGSLGELRSL